MNKKKILIVDDVEDTLLVLEKQVTTAGYEVITANNGAEAISLAKEQLPDLIVLDVRMPGMDGGEVAARLREDQTTQEIPVVYSTCLLSESEDYRCSGKIMLAKSQDTEELIAVISEILQESEV